VDIGGTALEMVRMTFSADSGIVVLTSAGRIDYHRKVEIFPNSSQHINKTSIDGIKAAFALTGKLTPLEVFVHPLPP